MYNFGRAGHGQCMLGVRLIWQFPHSGTRQALPKSKPPKPADSNSWTLTPEVLRDLGTAHLESAE